jgi:hypothetical protein
MPRSLKKNRAQTSLLPSTSIKPKIAYFQNLSCMQDAARQQEQMLKQLFDYTRNSKKMEENYVHESKLSIPSKD